jgi:autotransporter-associated beta strand protein
MAISAGGTITLNSSANAFAGPILLKAGSLVLGVATSLDEADPGTAFSESNPVSLIDSEAGALFPVGTTVRVNGLMSPTAASPTATIENESAGAMIIKRTSSGGLSFRAVPGGTVVPP